MMSRAWPAHRSCSTQLAPRPPPAVTVVAGRDTFGLYRHERRPASEMDEAALQEHRAAVQAVYPPGFERGEGKVAA